MAIKKKTDQSKLIKVIERLPFPDEDKSDWVETLTNDGLNEVMIKEIRSKVPSLPQCEEGEELIRAQTITKLNSFFRQWRLSQNLRGFDKRGQFR